MTSFFFISLSNQVEGERKGGGVGLRGRGRDRGLRLCQELRGERGGGNDGRARMSEV